MPNSLQRTFDLEKEKRNGCCCLQEPPGPHRLTQNINKGLAGKELVLATKMKLDHHYTCYISTSRALGIKSQCGYGEVSLNESPVSTGQLAKWCPSKMFPKWCSPSCFSDLKSTHRLLQKRYQQAQNCKMQLPSNTLWKCHARVNIGSTWIRSPWDWALISALLSLPVTQVRSPSAEQGESHLPFSAQEHICIGVSFWTLQIH